MSRRIMLHNILLQLLGSPYVYFQPPDTLNMKYPCIVYSRDSVNTLYANDAPYITSIRYKITIIDSNPDSIIPGKVAMLPMCSFNRHYKADNLNHDVYNLYF